MSEKTNLLPINDRKFMEWCGLSGPKPSSAEMADYLKRELENREEVDAVEYEVMLHAIHALRQHDALVHASAPAVGLSEEEIARIIQVEIALKCIVDLDDEILGAGPASFAAARNILKRFAAATPNHQTGASDSRTREVPVCGSDPDGLRDTIQTYCATCGKLLSEELEINRAATAIRAMKAGDGETS